MAEGAPQRSNAYELFILVLTALSGDRPDP